MRWRTLTKVFRRNQREKKKNVVKYEVFVEVETPGTLQNKEAKIAELLQGKLRGYLFVTPAFAEGAGPWIRRFGFSDPSDSQIFSQAVKTIKGVGVLALRRNVRPGEFPWTEKTSEKIV